MIRLGVLGAASTNIQEYLRCLCAMNAVEVVGVASGNVEKGKKIEDEWGIAHYPEAVTVLQQELDAVLVCAMASQRQPLIEQAVAHVRYILCEAPLAPTLEGAHAVIQTCETQGILLQPAFHLRFAPALRSLKQFLDERKLGQILSIKLAYHGKAPAENGFDGTDGNGVILLRAPHAIDLLRWLLDTEITEMYTELGSLLHPADTDDVGLMSITLANGAYATLDVSWALPDKFPAENTLKIEVIGDAGSIQIDAFRQNVDFYGDGVAWVNWGSNPVTELVKDFVDCIKAGRIPSITGDDALRAQEVALAAYQSAGFGMPISLSSS